MEKLKVIFMGTPEFSVPILLGLINKYEVVLVVSQPDRKVGRKKEVKVTPIKEVCLLNNIEVFQPTNIKLENEKILSTECDIIITCAYGQIIPSEILSYPRLGCINVHGSLLPKYRGGAPIHHSIINGDSKTGITIMYMDKMMDSGDIISQSEIDILDSDNVDSLFNKMSHLGRDLLLDTMPSIIDGSNDRVCQNIDEVSFGYNITREEELIDFCKSSREVFNQIRGLSSVPGAYTLLDGNVFKVYDSRIGTGSFEKCGIITKIYNDGIGVSTADGEIILTKIKPFGKKMMLASDFILGINKDNYIGKVLGNENN